MFEQVYLNRHDANTDGSLTVADPNSFLSPYEILPTAKRKPQYLGIVKGFFLLLKCMLCLLI